MRITSLLVSAMILISSFSNLLADPLKPEEGKTAFVAQAWAPAPFTSMIGDLKLDVFYLMPGVAAPISGVLIAKEDFTKLEFIGNKQQEWCDERLVKERVLCDAKIKECVRDCEILNQRMSEQIDLLNKDVANEKFKLVTLQDKFGWWKIGSISAVSILSGLLIYQAVK